MHTAAARLHTSSPASGVPHRSARAVHHDPIRRQCSLEPLCGLHVQLFDATAAFEHQVIALNHPATPIPPDALGRLCKGAHRQAGQQHPAQQLRGAGLILPRVSV